MMQVLTGARLFDGERFHEDCALVVEGERIQAITPHAERPRGAPERDLGGGLLAPGFIDVQVNGGGGALLNDGPSLDVVRRIAESHRNFGTTSLLPTCVTDTPEVQAEAIRAVRAALGTVPGVIGIHLEGPFLDVRRKGAHVANLIREMNEDDADGIVGADCGIVLSTIAPSRVRPDLVGRLAAGGVLVSLGHAEASYAEARAALDAGATAFTHLYNAMTQLTGREPGMVGAALSDPSSFIGVIADGHHVDDASLRIAFAAKSLDRFMLISDAMSPAAGGPDSFELMGRRVSTVNGRLQLDDGTLAGSRLTMDEAVRYCVERLRVDLAAALRMASTVPAAFLRRGADLGRIAPGCLANLVHLDDQLKVRETWISGV
jgi:N-acetylglucosamine-6-phosphate deacetylase